GCGCARAARRALGGYGTRLRAHRAWTAPRLRSHTATAASTAAGSGRSRRSGARLPIRPGRSVHRPRSCGRWRGNRPPALQPHGRAAPGGRGWAATAGSAWEVRTAGSVRRLDGIALHTDCRKSWQPFGRGMHRRPLAGPVTPCRSDVSRDFTAIPGISEIATYVAPTTKRALLTVL